MLAIDFLGREYEERQVCFSWKASFFEVEVISCQKDTTYQASKQASKIEKISLCEG